MKAFRQDLPQFTPTQGESPDGARKNYNACLRDVDGVTLGASSGASAMEIDAPGNNGNRMKNQFDEERWSLDDLMDGSRDSAHGMTAETRDEFEALRVNFVYANVKAPRGTREVVALASTGLDHRKAALPPLSKWLRLSRRCMI